jgi:hypothetical protein
MNNSIQYVHEKMYKAMYELAANRNNIRMRIDDSFHQFWLLKEDDFPDEGKEMRAKIDKLMTKNKAKQGYIIPHNIKYMPLARAEEIASLIFELYLVVMKEELKMVCKSSTHKVCNLI